MTEQENFKNEVQVKFAVQDEKFKSLATSMEEFKREMSEFKNEMRDFKQEMREKDNQRRAEIAEIRQLFNSMHNQNIAVIVGVVAIAVAVFLK